jgi:hypothetical protein
MSARIGIGLALAVVVLLVAPPGELFAAPALAEARELFAQNRWHDAREQVRSHWRTLDPSELELARYLIGRAYDREAELMHWVRAFATEVGLDYLAELADDESSREVAWIPLFTGLYGLAAGNERDAERALAGVAKRTDLPESWRELAHLRRAVALHRLGRAEGTRTLTGQPSHEARYWRLVLMDESDAAPAARAAEDPERRWAACVLLRAGRPKDADRLLADLDFDHPSAEHRQDPHKVLRFYDPLVLEAHERVLREQAVRWLRPLAAGADGPQGALSRYHAGVNLHHLGRRDEARSLLESAAKSAPNAQAQGRARVMLTAATLGHAQPSPGDLASLWRSSTPDPHAVLLWASMEPNGLSRTEPFASLLPKQLEVLGASLASGTDRAATGRWALARLRAGAEASEMVRILSRARDNANKNKVEANDPLLLVAIALASYRNADYAQSLEILYAVSEAFPGVRGLHWNLQGTYAARQKAGGEARISQ